MRGFFVDRKAGWDTHGLPVELAVEKELGLKSKKEIEQYGIDKFNQQCKTSVWQYKEEWEKLTERIGYWLDLEHPYVTYDNSYIESLWAIMATIGQQKTTDGQPMVYQAYRVTPYCPRCGTTLSSHEIAQGYADVTEESVYVKFRLRGTLPGNVALAVGADIVYVTVKLPTGERLILAKERLSVLDGAYEIVEERPGRDLVKVDSKPTYDPLYAMTAHHDEASKAKAYQIYLADFVTTTEGTGIVHTAVMYGEDDYKLGQTLGLPMYHVVGDDGRFLVIKELEGFIGGKWFKDADVDIKDDLQRRDLLYKREFTTHSYPFCWRCDTPLMYYARDSWYIRMSAVREKLLANNATVNWVPAAIRDGRFGEWLREVKDWAFSRERYWGTPLPIWRCDQGHAAMFAGQAFPGVLEEITKQLKAKGPVDYHRPYIDAVVLPCAECGQPAKRIPEVADVWFDSGAMPFAQHHYPFENRELIEEGTSYPADYIAEAIDQTRGWFYTLLAVSTLLDRGASYKSVICLGHINDAKGKKMSKSRGNVVDPWAMIDKYGADTVRWHFYTMNQPGDTKNFAETDLANVVKKQWLIVWNILAFYHLAAPAGVPKDVGRSKHILDRWLEALTAQTIHRVTAHLEAYRLTEAGREIESFITQLSTWYLRRSRDRLKGEQDERHHPVLATFHRSLLALARLLAPLTPMVAEALYQELDPTAKAEGRSVHLETWPADGEFRANEALLTTMDDIRRLAEAGHGLRAEAGIKLRQPLSQFVATLMVHDKEALDVLKAELNVKEIHIGKKAVPVGAEWQKKTIGSLSVAIDTTITDELRAEGLIREFIRHVNALRKEMKLTINDRVPLYVDQSNEAVAELVEFYAKTVQADTLTHSIGDDLTSAVAKATVDLDGTAVTFGLGRS